MEERRRCIRVYTNIPINYRHVGRDKVVQTSALVNLGRMGLRFLCEESLTRGDMLKLSFQLPSVSHIISASAKVIWTNHLRENGKDIYEVGAKFDSMNLEDQLAIQQFVKDELIAERGRRIKAYFYPI